jgi:pyruvate dehydrogenase E2 component (dihydrolipoamide acetyltransferase)
MANIIEMPKLSDTMQVGTLVKWWKKEGDAVKSGDMLAEVETDKATMELESFFDGTLLKIFAAGGEQVAIGAPLCAIGKAGEKVDAPAGKPAAPAGEPKKDPAPAEKDRAGASTAAKNETRAEPAAAATPPAREPAATDSGSGKRPASSRAEGERVRISPLARKLAAEKKLDPAQIQGSGPGGRIVRVDVLAFEKNGGAKAASKTGGAPSFGTGPSAFAKGPIQEERTVAVSNMRGAIARRLLESKTQLPHFYVEIEIDAAPLLRVPQVNGSWEGDKIRYFGAAHVSFAVAIEDGLITPVIRDTHQKSVFQISSEAKSLGKLAKEKKLKPDQFTGGTFCVSNLGMMGIPRFSAIINPPNAAILAVGTTVKKPVVRNDQIVVGQTMTLTLSCDHRVVDGAIGAQYLNALKTLLESPALLLV